MSPRVPNSRRPPPPPPAASQPRDRRIVELEGLEGANSLTRLLDALHRAAAVQHGEARDFPAGAAQQLPPRPYRVKRRGAGALEYDPLCYQPRSKARTEGHA